MNATLIEKEQMGNLHYPSHVSEKTGDKKSDLLNKCRKALSLGNLHKVKCTIFFYDEQGLKKVNTTIWGVSEEHIVLKGGIALNLRFVEDVTF